MDCTFADDDYLVAAFPGVVKTTPERWAVLVDEAQPGPYSVTLQGVAYPYEAQQADDVTDVRNGLLSSMAALMSVALSPTGPATLLLGAATNDPLGINVAGPDAGTISATLISGGDGNAAGRAFWLAKVKCWLPSCCLITCADDYTLMHAALAAHYIDLFAGGQNSGTASMGAYKSMRLGPASLEAVAKAWAAANPADSDLDDGGPGSMYLSIRARYIFGVRCG